MASSSRLMPRACRIRNTNNRSRVSWRGKELSLSSAKTVNRRSTGSKKSPTTKLSLRHCIWPAGNGAMKKCTERRTREEKEDRNRAVEDPHDPESRRTHQADVAAC